MVNEITGKTINRKSHSFCHFGKAFGFYLVLICEGWKIGAFTMYMGFN
jgi:hypothetical protein